MNIKEKVQSGILGLASGDSLSYLLNSLKFETNSIENFISTFPNSNMIEELIVNASDERELNQVQRRIKQLPLPGLYSSLTQESLIIINCLVQKKDIDLNYICQVLIRFSKYKHQDRRGLLRNPNTIFSKSINNMINFTPYHLSGINSSDDSTLARVIPLGFYYFQNPDNLMKNIIKLASLTHRNINAISSAGIIAYLIAYIISSESNLKIDKLINQLQSFILEIEERILLDEKHIYFDENNKHLISNCLKILANILEMDNMRAYQAIDIELSFNNYKSYNNVITSLFFSLYLFLKQEDQLFDAISKVYFNNPRDLSFISYLTAIYATYSGLDSIPQNLINAIPNSSDLIQYSQALIEPNYETPDLRDLFSMEKDLCILEDEYRLKHKELFYKIHAFTI